MAGDEVECFESAQRVVHDARPDRASPKQLAVRAGAGREAGDDWKDARTGEEVYQVLQLDGRHAPRRVVFLIQRRKIVELRRAPTSLSRAGRESRGP